jgi:hypothetical protein
MTQQENRSCNALVPAPRGTTWPPSWLKESARAPAKGTPRPSRLPEEREYFEEKVGIAEFDDRLPCVETQPVTESPHRISSADLADQYEEGKRLFDELQAWLASEAAANRFRGKPPAIVADLVDAGVEFIRGYLRDFHGLFADGKNPLLWIRSHVHRTREFITGANEVVLPNAGDQRRRRYGQRNNKAS